MHRCKVCGEALQRVHRRWWQRLVHRSVYLCKACGAKEPHHRRFSRYRVSPHCRCPRCGRKQLKVFRKLDKIENYQRGMLRAIQKWLGAKLYYCDRCRLQFYDLRPTQTDA